MRQHFVLEIGIGHFNGRIKYMDDKFFLFFVFLFFLQLNTLLQCNKLFSLGLESLPGCPNFLNFERSTNRARHVNTSLFKFWDNEPTGLQPLNGWFMA